MVNVKRFVFNPAQANCYVVSDETKECVIIDPCARSEQERVQFQRYIQEEGLIPVRCLLTHGHYDHILSCDLVRDLYGLYPEVHQRDKAWMDLVDKKIEEVFGVGGFKYDIVKPQHYLQDNEVIAFGSHRLITLHTPGHSPGSAVFYCEEEHIAFTGDTLFRKGVGRSDMLYGWIEDLMNSLRHITTLMPNNCMIYPGHYLDSTIGFEKKKNPYLLPSWYKKNTGMKHLVVLTGAGISKESGLSTFRDKDGMWQNLNAPRLASIQGYRKNRSAVLDFYNARRKNLLTVEPNHAHKVLAELEKDYVVSIITQNVDDLHERAGSTNVLHLHGELRKVTGSNNPNDPNCIIEKPLDEPISIGEKAADGSQLRPFVVFFGEKVLNMKPAERIVKDADIFVIIGTSLQVYPAAELKDYVPWKIPCYIIDPSELWSGDIYGFEHIQTTAVVGIDILKDKLAHI